MPSEDDLATLGAVANRKIFVAYASADLVNQASATRNLRKGAPRGARAVAAVSAGLLGIAWPGLTAAAARARPHDTKSRRSPLARCFYCLKIDLEASLQRLDDDAGVVPSGGDHAERVRHEAHQAGGKLRRESSIFADFRSTSSVRRAVSAVAGAPATADTARRTLLVLRKSAKIDDSRRSLPPA